MRTFSLAGLLLFVHTPSYAFIDSIISGAQSVAQEAHKEFMENELIQLVLEAKQNYDASVRIYNEVKLLNQGRGLVHNVAADLGAKAQGLTQSQQRQIQSDFTYRGDSPIDREIAQMNANIQNGIAQKGIQAVDTYGGVINQKTAVYINSLKQRAKAIATRQARSQAARSEGVNVAQLAPDLQSKALGLGLQTNSDAVDALNDILQNEMLHDAEADRRQVNQDQAIAQVLKFFEASDGMAKTLNDSFYLVRLSRAPGLFAGTRQTVSQLVGGLLALFLAAGLLFDFARNGRYTGTLIPATIGLPLVLVIFGLIFYDQILVAYSTLIDAMEQTIAPGSALVQNISQVSSQFMTSPLNLMNSDYWIKYFALFIGCLSWAVSIVFLWVRFAFFSLLYCVGPLFIVMALFEPLRKMTYGWMMGVVHVGLWGIFMRILSMVVATSGISAFAIDGSDPEVLKAIFASMVVNLIFLAFSLLTPYFVQSIIGGHIGEKAGGLVSPLKNAVIRNAAKAASGVINHEIRSSR